MLRFASTNTRLWSGRAAFPTTAGAAWDGDDEKKEVAQQVVTETLEQGNVDIRIFITYIRGFGAGAATLALLLGVVYPATLVIQNFWLDKWSSHPSDDTFYASWYGAMGTFAAFVFLLQVCTFAFGALKASSCLHSQMLQVLRTG